MRLSSLLQVLLRPFILYSTPPAPSAPPPVPSEGAEDFQGAEENVDWEALNDSIPPGSDDDDPTSTGPAVREPQSKATPTPEGAEATRTSTPEKPTTPPPAVPGQEGEVTPPEVKPEVTQPNVPLTPEQQAAQQTAFEEWEKGEIEKMSAQYAAGLSEDDVASLQTEPEKVLPRLAAQIRMDTMKATISAMGHLMPQLLNANQQSVTLENQARDAFFGANDDLKDVPIDKIVKAGQAYRQLNPDVKDPNEVIEGVGNMVRAILKRERKPAPPPPPAQKKGYKPAGNGSSQVPPAPGQKTDADVWSDLADD